MSATSLTASSLSLRELRGLCGLDGGGGGFQQKGGEPPSAVGGGDEGGGGSACSRGLPRSNTEPTHLPERTAVALCSRGCSPMQ